MTITLNHHRTSNHNHTARNIVVACLALAIVVFGIPSLTNTQDTRTATPAAETESAVVDPIGLGSALSVTYDTTNTQPIVVDPIGLGSALSVTYDTTNTQPAVVDPIG